MSYRTLYLWGILLILGSILLSGCGGATPTPVLEATSLPAPSLPTAALPAATEVPPTKEELTVTAASPPGGSSQDATPDGTSTVTITPTQANPLDLPFLMKIDRVSVVPGRGTLLEGRVAHGTLQSNGSVEILGPQNQILDAALLATLASSVMREQVTVGDYAGILVQGVDATQVTPGMLLAETGAYNSYEEALQELQ